MLRSPTKLVANIPPGVGADSSRPYPNIFKYAYPFHRIRISTLSNTHIHVIKYTYPFHRIRISVSHFVGVYVYAGTMNRPLRLRTIYQNIADRLPKHKQHKHKNTTIVHHPTVTYFIKHTYSLTLIHIIYNIMHIFNCLREHLDNTKTAETYLNINLLKICKRLIFFTL